MPRGQNVGQMSEGSGHLRRLHLCKYNHPPPLLVSTTFYLNNLKSYTQVSDIHSLPGVSRHAGSNQTHSGNFNWPQTNLRAQMRTQEDHLPRALQQDM